MGLKNRPPVVETGSTFVLLLSLGFGLGVARAGRDGLLGLLQVNGLDEQHLAVHGLAGLVGVVVGAHAVLDADHVTLVNQVVHGVLGLGRDEALQVDELALAGAILGLEVVLGGDGQHDLPGAILIFGDVGVTSQTAFCDSKVTSIHVEFLLFN